MIALLAWNFLLRRLRSPARLLIALVLAGQDLAQVLMSGWAGPAESALALIGMVLFGTGLIGQERGDGSLALMLTRPISRSSVVLAAWLAAAAAGLGFWLFLTLMQLTVALLPSIELSPSASQWQQHSLTALFGCMGLAAVTVFFGAAFKGIGGLGAHAGLALLASSCVGLSRDSGHEQFQALASGALDLLFPVPNFSDLLAPRGWSLLEVLTPASNAALLLLATCWLLARAQFSYSNKD